MELYNTTSSISYNHPRNGGESFGLLGGAKGGNKKAYDRIDVVVPKGRRKVIADYAKAHGKTTNKFIVEAIDRAMEESRRLGQDNGPDRAAGAADEN